ncbi:hypothetical protein GGS21DRAFT_359774 [Xylaria nigripes]|nr:hypothetical protein GGS21DRAFT_359774 [Xylaria nigripes]
MGSQLLVSRFGIAKLEAGGCDSRLITWDDLSRYYLSKRTVHHYFGDVNQITPLLVLAVSFTSIIFDLILISRRNIVSGEQQQQQEEEKKKKKKKKENRAPTVVYELESRWRLFMRAKSEGENGEMIRGFRVPHRARFLLKWRKNGEVRRTIILSRLQSSKAMNHPRLYGDNFWH